MAHTIGEEPWKYLDLLNVCIKIVVTILIGVILAYFKVFDQKTFVPQSVKFVFRVCLPLMIMRGLGIVINFYDPKFSWKYICSFLILRAFALILCFVWIIATSLRGQKHGIGQVAVYWLTLTWISTVILGVPISKAVFGSEALGTFYGLLAGISSFIFQLPLQLFFLECHVLEQEYLAQIRGPDAEAPEESTLASPAHSDDHDSYELEKREEPTKAIDQFADNQGAEEPAKVIHHVTDNQGAEELEEVPLFLWLRFARRGDIWRGIFFRVIANPILWGIAVGFFLSLTELGPKYFKPGSPDYVPGLGWFSATTKWFGDMVSPLSLFTMGVWMQNQGMNLFQLRWYVAVMSMISKLVIVPVIMIGLAKAMNLSDEAGRAAVLIAALPISMASFSLGSQYKIGEALLSENVALGTILMLPTIVLWNLFMDKIDLFPIPN